VFTTLFKNPREGHRFNRIPHQEILSKFVLMDVKKEGVEDIIAN